MGAWKLDLNFRAGSQGWVETYYADFGLSDFGQVNPIAVKLGQLRIALSADPVELISYSVTDPLTDGQQGETIDFRPILKGTASIAYGAGDPATSVNIAFSSNVEKRRRRIFMRGVPDIVVTSFGKLDSVQFGLWEAKFLVLRDYLLGRINGQQSGTVYGWLARKRVNVDPGLASYAYVVGDLTPTFTLPADFFPEGDVGKRRYVRFSGFNNAQSPLNREMIVLVTSRTTCRPVKAIAAFPQTTPGQCRRYNTLPELVTATNIGIERPGTRRPGAPFSQRRGRSKNRPRG